MSRNNNKRRGNGKPQNKGGNTKNYKDRNRSISKDTVDKHNDRNDIMNKQYKESSMGDNPRNNAPSWYYLNDVMADNISRFSMNLIGGITKIHGTPVASVVRVGYLPSVGTTPNKETELFESAHAYGAKGINLASQQWWYTLTARSGRGTVYSKADISALIAAFGSLIEIDEFIRRAFGVANTYSQENRSLPNALWLAMGIDPTDFIDQMANYRKKFNKLVTTLNQLPIPSNIAWLAKCQDMYQHIYTDSPASTAQFYVPVPLAIWTLDEETYERGTVLRTTPVVSEIKANVFDDKNFEYLAHLSSPRKFSEYLSIYEEAIYKLLYSSTFSVIFADIMYLATNSGLGLWTFDSLKDDYVVIPEYNENYLLQLHNATILRAPASYEAGVLEAEYADPNNTTFQARYEHGTPLNNVYADPDDDILVYDPSIPCSSSSDVMRKHMDGVEYVNYVDSTVPQLNTDDRIEMTRYIARAYPPSTDMSSQPSYTVGYGKNNNPIQSYMNWLLPDHWIAEFSVGSPVIEANLLGEYPVVSPHSSVVGSVSTEEFGDDVGDYLNISAFNWNNPLEIGSSYITDCDWAPSVVLGLYENMQTLGWQLKTLTRYWDVNYPASLDVSWLVPVTDMTYLALFNFR